MNEVMRTLRRRDPTGERIRILPVGSLNGAAPGLAYLCNDPAAKNPPCEEVADAVEAKYIPYGYTVAWKDGFDDDEYQMQQQRRRSPPRGGGSGGYASTSYGATSRSSRGGGGGGSSAYDLAAGMSGLSVGGSGSGRTTSRTTREPERSSRTTREPERSSRSSREPERSTRSAREPERSSRSTREQTGRSEARQTVSSRAEPRDSRETTRRR
jgi:hypothetical protein